MNRIIGLGLLILLSSCAHDRIESNANFKTMMIKSSGEIETTPDMAEFTIYLNCLKPTVKGAKQCLVDESNALTQSLLDYGIDKEDLLTTAISMNKSYRWANNSQVFQGYNSATSINVKVKDLDKLDEIYSELLENRNLNLNGLSYSHSKLDSLENKAYIKAFHKAEVLAKKLIAEIPEEDLELLKIGNVSITSSLPNNRGASSDAAMAEVAEQSAGNSISINTGNVRVNATLYVEFHIK
ncbi:SIMPL domain-containing protein [Gramella sp. AN32]|uniref:SIMPL domain-containing protein n=1 Tax=Christiangramia antarctica TaxID=2058158 RepID=A0ABW5X9N2_9FLAO|nr:SIMPL domain-containing protein [Gramella sp. AN32]MCM4154550.1 hypothetical protein [Gramella sp. AN32]